LRICTGSTEYKGDLHLILRRKIKLAARMSYCIFYIGYVLMFLYKFALIKDDTSFIDQMLINSVSENSKHIKKQTVQ